MVRTRRNERGGSAVSFCRSREQSEQTEVENDDINFTVAPYIQTYLARNSPRVGCCGSCFLVPFERAARNSWWDPRFDSDILEAQYQQSSFAQLRLRFQYALLYILTISLSWFVYFVATGLEGKTTHWIPIASTFSLLFLSMAVVLTITYTNTYRCYMLPFSATVAVVLIVLSLAFVVFSNVTSDEPDITPVGQFSLCVEILLLIYTVIPLPLYLAVGISTVYSIAFEVLMTYLGTSRRNEKSLQVNGIVLCALLHLCIHLIGIHILVMTKVRMRGTFMKVGQSLLVRKQLEIEQQLKEKMIHSVMPPKVAAWLLSGGRDEEFGRNSIGSEDYHQNTGSDIRSLFRPFNMNHMDNVSILFADIVGFTKMSSNKTAEELVAILNDLFGRFDDLCAIHGCEKISTLGDCYYCVAGCPVGKEDHAKSCVDMGLSMIDAIKQFDAERNEGVNMRVGVHTGTVLCGIVGTKRFKFDVWSNDVTFANQMESTGKPGKVHISEKTYNCLDDSYVIEDGETVNGQKTYFIKGRKTDIMLEKLIHWKNSREKPVAIAPSSPLLEPVSRPRVLSCNQPQQPKRTHYLHLVATNSLPNCSGNAKSSSLPSIIDNDNDTCDENERSNSPSSLSSRVKLSPKGKPWLKSLKNSEHGSEIEPLSLECVSYSQHTDKDSRAHDSSDQHITFQVSNLGDAIKMENSAVQLELPGVASSDDQLSVCLSVNSRKDSGIRSTSRRSSIQQQIYVMNGMAQGDILTHRVSGYYTSSQSSLNDTETEHDCRVSQLPLAFGDTFGTCFHKLRKQSDLQLIRCVQDNVPSPHGHFVKPPLCRFTLFFRDESMEKEYRIHAHKITELDGDSPPTLVTSRYNTYIDIIISALVFLMVVISLFLLVRVSTHWIVICSIFGFVQLFVVTSCMRYLARHRYQNSSRFHLSKKFIETCSQWYPWHVCGAVLISLPVISILVNFSCLENVQNHKLDYYYSYLIFIGLVHFCNFTQLNCWMKSVLATTAGIIYVCLVSNYVCPLPYFRTILNEGSLPANNHFSVNHNTSTRNATGGSHPDASDYYTYYLYHSEIFLDVLLLLMLVWFLNREFEISYRLSFHSNIVAAKDKARVQNMKDQADWLLHNIIPKHVADVLKTTAKYSENHKDVGIIFASIVNFNEMYDESYQGGKEYLRVLNELIGDFDELLNKPEFKNIEKIKTIGSTFMAASGLNPEVRRQSNYPYEHLFELMEFAIALQKVIENFNNDLLEFNLILRVGYNFGDVTAGVIGTSKLFYDIWGDAVNIASRMDSTGVKERIQVPGSCVPILSERYEFELRGSVYVKGKDNMTVYLLSGKKENRKIGNG